MTDEAGGALRLRAGFLAMLLFAGAGAAHLCGRPASACLAIATGALALFVVALFLDDGHWHGPLAGR